MAGTGERCRVLELDAASEATWLQGRFSIRTANSSASMGGVTLARHA
jgi:hypothetical protein